MDLNYLLVLQQLRESLPAFVGNIFWGISFIGEGPLLAFLVLVVYWCLDKRIGQIAMVCFCASNFIVQLVKNTACVYRPWVRSDAIVPMEAALEGATGYSFPSGHAAGSTASLGCIAWLVRKKHRVVSVLCVVFILLVAFSRNFLGVHTPQDVLVGLAIGIIMIALVNALFNWIDLHDSMTPGHNKDVIVLVVVLVFSVASIIFLEVKSYPLDYVNGALLVDPEVMKKGSFQAAGLLSGFAVGWFLERRFVGFTTDASVTVAERVVRGIVGLAITGVTYLASDAVFKSIMTYNWAKMSAMFTLSVIAVFVVPLLFNLINVRFGKQPDRESVRKQIARESKPGM